MTKNQKGHKTIKTPKDVFDHAAVMEHSSNPGYSPLRQDRSRTNYDLTVLMSQYIDDVYYEDSTPRAIEAAAVLMDFMLYIGRQTSEE
jgi:hypothetical protein